MATEHDAAADRGGEDPGSGTGEQHDRETELAARLELLEAENERLRREYRRATQVTYRRTAVALAGLGVLALLGAATFPATRTVLVALGAVGLFGGVLTYYLTPERVLAASVAQHLDDATRENLARLADELGLQDEVAYVPIDDDRVRAFCPQHPAGEYPDDEQASLDDRLFVVSEDPREQGVALVPAGAGLFAEFETARAGPFAEDVAGAADQLADAIVEQFELATAAVPDATPAEGRVAVGISDPAITPLDDAHHPIASVLATGFARHRDRPVQVSVERGDARFDATVHLDWDER